MLKLPSCPTIILERNSLHFHTPQEIEQVLALLYSLPTPPLAHLPTIFLQVLSRMCSLPTGHKLVADAVSMLRLRFGEPVRFKFLIGKNSFYVFKKRVASIFLKIANIAKRT